MDMFNEFWDKVKNYGFVAIGLGSFYYLYHSNSESTRRSEEKITASLHEVSQRTGATIQRAAQGESLIELQRKFKEKITTRATFLFAALKDGKPKARFKSNEAVDPVLYFSLDCEEQMVAALRVNDAVTFAAEIHSNEVELTESTPDLLFRGRLLDIVKTGRSEE